MLIRGPYQRDHNFTCREKTAVRGDKYDQFSSFQTSDFLAFPNARSSQVFCIQYSFLLYCKFISSHACNFNEDGFPIQSSSVNYFFQNHMHININLFIFQNSIAFLYNLRYPYFYKSQTMKFQSSLIMSSFSSCPIHMSPEKDVIFLRFCFHCLLELFFFLSS